MTPGLTLWLAGVVLLVNVLAYMAFRLDKKSAIEGGWRLPEATLLTLAALGGWPGAKLAQRRFRHKTRKQPFRTLLNLIPVVWLILALSIGMPPETRALVADILP